MMLTIISKQLIDVPRDIIVTTPKSQMDAAAQEAADCLRAGSGSYYFRRFSSKPKGLVAGSRIFYVEDGYVRGFGTVSRVEEGGRQCETTGRQWGNGFYAIIPADSWKWIKPVPMKGFQGWRYYDAGDNAMVVGDWKDAKPVVS